MAACFLRFLGSAYLSIFIWALSLSLLSLSCSILLLLLAFSSPCEILSLQGALMASLLEASFISGCLLPPTVELGKTPPNFCCFLKLTHGHLLVMMVSSHSQFQQKLTILCFLLHRCQLHAGSDALSLSTCILGFLEIPCHLILLLNIIHGLLVFFN